MIWVAAALAVCLLWIFLLSLCHAAAIADEASRKAHQQRFEASQLRGLGAEDNDAAILPVRMR